MLVQGTEIVNVLFASVISGGDEDSPVYNNDVRIVVDSSKSESIVAVEHWTELFDAMKVHPDSDRIQPAYESLWEVKHVGPFVYFSLFNFNDDGTICTQGGAYGSKYLDVHRGGWSSRASVFNRSGITDEIMEVEIVDIQEGDTITVAHMPKNLVTSLVVLFDANRHYPDTDVHELIDGIIKDSIWSKVFYADIIEPTVTKFANHSGV
jgi:hypothetical protein